MLTQLLTNRYALEPAYHDRVAEVVMHRIINGKENLFAGLVGERKKLHTWNKSAGLTPYGYKWQEKILSSTGHVLIVPVIGAMSRYGGACSFGSEDMANWIRAANEDPNISAIVLEINSPGGEVDGTGALGAAVKNSRKPVVAWVAGMAASAAYWVASQAREIWMEDAISSEVGSIGVLSMHVDQTGALEQEGYKVTIIRSDGSESKALYNSVEPLTDEIVADVKTSLNSIRTQFISTVKAGRPGITDESVFSGKMFEGKQAKKLKMADRFGSLLDAVVRADQLAKQANSQSQKSNNSSSMSLKTTLAGVFGVSADDAAEVTEEQISALAVSVEEHKQTADALEQANQKVEALEADKMKAEGERDAAQASVKAYTDLGVGAAEAKTALDWYQAEKAKGVAPAGDESENKPDKRKVSALTQKAIDAKNRIQAAKK